MTHFAPRLPRSGALPGALLGATLWLAVAACSAEQANLIPDAGVGPNPVLPEPQRTLVPTVNVAKAKPWPRGQMPVAAPGLQVQAFADKLDHPRWMMVLPNGDVLVAETNAPERPDDARGIKGQIMKKLMARVGARGASANRITLLRDADGDGRAEMRRTFVQDLNSPFGMALVGDRFYVADTDAVREFIYTPGATHLEGAGRVLTELPAGPRNHHWTKSLIASPDGSKLYATVGSNSNVGENGIDAEEGRAAIWEIDRASGAKRIYATGLRNPNGMAFTADGRLWTVVNERDELGNDLVPDYLTSVRDGAFYGWPYSYWGQRVDDRVKPPRPDLVSRAVAPDYALGSHVAPLGLTTVTPGPLARALDSLLPETTAQWSPKTAAVAPQKGPRSSWVQTSATAATAATSTTATPATPATAKPTPAATASTAPPSSAVRGMVVGLHGSWNRRPLSGYSVIYIPFGEDNRPAGMPRVVLDGFVSPEGEAWGRPVGVAIDARGALLVADDVGDTIWRVQRR
jgi:glucose/arabinose dehydrogenase